MTCKVGIGFYFVTVLFAWCSGKPSRECISDYRGITLPLLSNARKSQELELVVNGEVLHLTLWPLQNVFTENATINFIDHDEKITLNYEQYAKKFNIPLVMYDGWVNDESETSLVHGTVNEQGIFDGYFNYQNATYYLEPYSRYFTEKHRGYNAVLYKSADVRSRCGRRHLRKPRMANCTSGWTRWLRRRSIIPETVHRRPRAEFFDMNRRICHMKLVADFRFYTYVLNTGKDPIRELIIDANEQLLTYHLIEHEDVASKIGIRVYEYDIYRNPIRDDLKDIEVWNPMKFFEEMGLYDFDVSPDIPLKRCAGFYITYRMMEKWTEVNGPSLFKANIVSYEQGLCSHLKPTIPNGTMADYGPYITKVMPLNFMHKNTRAEKPQVLQAVRQFMHLMGAWDDEEFPDKRCQGVEEFTGTWHWRTIGGQYITPVLHKFIGAFPLPDDTHDFRISECTRRSISTYLRMFGRRCIRICNHECGPWDTAVLEKGKFVDDKATWPTTAEPTEGTINDWTEVCFRMKIATASRHQATMGVAPFLVGLTFMGQSCFL